MSIGPAMARLGNAGQDALDAGEAGGTGCLLLQASLLGWVGSPSQGDGEGYSGQGEGHSSTGLRRVASWGQPPLSSSALLGARDPRSSGGTEGLWGLLEALG